MAISKFKPTKKYKAKKEIMIKLPLTVTLERKTKEDKRIILNINNYGHWHYRTFIGIKKQYYEDLEDKLKGLKLMGRIKLEYRLFKGTNRISDRMNVLAIQDKIFCDALKEHGCIKDDDDSIIIGQSFRQTEIDKEDPRAEVLITYNL